MRRRPFQMSLRQRLWLYSTFTLSAGSGIAWAIIWHFLREDPEMAHPIESSLLKAHLAGAFILLVAIGATLPTHASKSWAAKINRAASSLFAASMLGAVITGYGILAFFWETRTMHFTHIVFGVSMVVLLPAHIIVGRHLENKRITAKHRAK